jgi:mRNA interferase MazF
MVIARGEIWWAELPDPVGSSPGYRRPVVVMQSEQFNRSRINTVVVVAITSNTRLANAPGNVFLPKAHTSLPQDSVANVSQLLTIDKVFLTQRVTTLPDRYMQRIEDGVRLVLSL